jgi:hypothetical protein
MNNNPEQLSLMLQERWKYRQHSADESAKSLLAMNPDLQDAFSKYLETEQFPDKPKYFGLNSVVLSGSYPFHPPAVFMMLDWISKDPESALQMLVEQYRKPLPKEFTPEELVEWKKAHAQVKTDPDTQK